jgi:(p)ppGpp synthase/HD superfamily hydrolase
MDKATKADLISVIEDEAKLKMDSFIEGAISMAEEVHANVKREDGTSPFLETHIWPVTIDVIRHYLESSKPLTTLQIVSAILHDVMEDNDKILDLYAAKSYGFDAYFVHRFGDYVYKVATTLKTKPLSNFSERFRQYCSDLSAADYDVKVIKLADRLNNMRFISKVPYHDKVKRYIKEAEDFYIAFSLTIPQMDDYYTKMRTAYEDLKKLDNKQDSMLVQKAANRT